MNSAINWNLLDALCAVHAVSGREERIIRMVRDHVTPLLDDVTVDRLGNVSGLLRGSQNPDTVLMLQSHIDELGLIIRGITDDGFLRFERVGGVPEKSLLGQRVDILTDDDRLVPGYVGAKSHHVTSPDEKFNVPRVHDMYVDVGAPSREAVLAMGIQVGDPVTYHPNFHRLGDGLIVSKALDNRVSNFIMLETLARLHDSPPPCTIAFAFTVLEEFSIRGSLPVVTRIKPDAILSLDITIATDTPETRELHPVVMRGGPAIKMMDFHGRGTLAGVISSPPFRRFIEGVAREETIPLQREVLIGVITDPAHQLYLGDYGQTIAALSIPHRYSHSAISACHETDIAFTIDLITAICRAFSPDIDLSRG